MVNYLFSRFIYVYLYFISLQISTEQKQQQFDGTIISINGSVVKCKLPGVFVFEVVYLSEYKLVSEVISIQKDVATVQCYEDTNGLRVGDSVTRSKNLLSLECGPGLCGQIIDGIARPFNKLANKQACSNNMVDRQNDFFIPRGLTASTLDHEKLFDMHFNPDFKVGDYITIGDIFAVTQENILVECKMMLPNYGYDQNEEKVACEGGKITFIEKDGKYNIDHTALKLQTADGQELHYYFWFKQPVRSPRPVTRKIASTKPLVIGQRVTDGMFQLAKGSCACVIGGFGCGKSVISQSSAKYSNVDIVIYTACGERGNECAEILQDFPEMEIEVDGIKSNLMNRTILIANTSNMPVAAREASIYCAITMGEYFRDQGYEVIIMADSTSRWAEAMREISSRMNELPSEGGYPSSLQAKLSQFYERAGDCVIKGRDMNYNNYQSHRVRKNEEDTDGLRHGSITVIGAVSPQGGDFSDPVAVATLNIVNVFWALSRQLAQRKHFPSIDPKISYSKCTDVVNREILKYRETMLTLLQKNTELQETAQLVGFEALDDQDKFIIAVSKTITEGFLQQNAYSDYDRFCPLQKTQEMMNCICKFYEVGKNVVEKIGFDRFQSEQKSLWNRINRMKFLNSNADGIPKVIEDLHQLYKDIEAIED